MLTGFRHRPRLDRRTALRLAVATFVLLTASFRSSAQTPEEKGHAIAVEADRRDSGFGDSTATFSMVLRDREGDEKTRELRAQVLEGVDDSDKSLVVFDSPPDVGGTAVLTHSHETGDDDQWLYLPALKRVKRIAAANQSAPFMGSEFSYEDFASEAVDKYDYRWVRDEACPAGGPGPASCSVVERRPRSEASGYSRELVWFDTLEYRTVRIDYYDRRDELLKTLTLSDHRQYLDRYWRAHELLMVNHQSGKSTRLIWSEFQFRVGLTDEDFTPRALSRIR